MIYVLRDFVPYEGEYLLGVYSSQAEAEAAWEEYSDPSGSRSIVAVELNVAAEYLG